MSVPQVRHLGGVQTPLRTRSWPFPAHSCLGGNPSRSRLHSPCLLTSQPGEQLTPSGPSCGTRGLGAFSLCRHIYGTSLRGTTIFSAIRGQLLWVVTKENRFWGQFKLKGKWYMCLLFQYFKIHLFHAYHVPVSGPILDLLHMLSHLILRFLWYRNYFYLHFIETKIKLDKTNYKSHTTRIQSKI